VFARGDTHDSAFTALRDRVLDLRRSITTGRIRVARDPRAS